jgi:predicted O-methyltransferase YrrM
MIDPHVVSYLRGLMPERDELLQEMETFAEEKYIPILDLETAALLNVLVKMVQPQRILEVGTAIGYSAIWLARCSEKATVVTLERDAERAAWARGYLARSVVKERVQLIEGDALEVIPTLSGEYDLVFLDAAKGQYPRFLELLTPLLRQGGVLLSDNVLFQGMVASGDEVKHKLRTMVNRLREYNRVLAEHPQYETAFVPVGDGLAVSVKR